MLTEEPGYTDVAALSAFARDRNNGLERFSIQWRVTEPPKPAEEPDCRESAPRTGQAEGVRHELPETQRVVGGAR